MASKLFICDAFKKYILDGTVDLDTDTLKAALVTSSPSSAYSAWAATTAYSLGDVRRPTTRNGHRYRCTTAGTSGGSEPSWPKTDGATVSDGTVVWTEYGGDLADADEWGDVSANEVANGNGYTSGGAAMSGSSITYSGKTTTWDASDVTWPSLTKTMRYAFLYANKVANGKTNPLIGYVLLDDTPADVSVTSVDFVLNWNASGILTLS